MAKNDSISNLVNSAKRNKSAIMILLGVILTYIVVMKAAAYSKYGRTRRSILNEMNELWKVKRIEEIEGALDKDRILSSQEQSDTWVAANPWVTMPASEYDLLTSDEKNALGRGWYVDWFDAVGWGKGLDIEPWGSIAFVQICEEMGLPSNDVMIKTLQSRVGDSFSFVV